MIREGMRKKKDIRLKTIKPCRNEAMRLNVCRYFVGCSMRFFFSSPLQEVRFPGGFVEGSEGMEITP